ncbi:hypothetical protein FA13DRAFT_185486 [Coprinellus micaceus]|uniref:Uncharacterized protein n=1 Tax=Coprinellus micaceus TaxID=71717 RepID=A0A4Y7THW5_COPMI|nr:hypothetical protein FA13DRAFT_185486 [Coprinellus micaceus]
MRFLKAGSRRLGSTVAEEKQRRIFGRKWCSSWRVKEACGFEQPRMLSERGKFGSTRPKLDGPFRILAHSLSSCKSWVTVIFGIKRPPAPTSSARCSKSAEQKLPRRRCG